MNVDTLAILRFWRKRTGISIRTGEEQKKNAWGSVKATENG
jgi:hypothetical protein